LRGSGGGEGMGVGRDGMSVNMVGTGDGGLLCCHSGSEGEKIEEIRERRKSGDCFYFMISSLSFSLLCSELQKLVPPSPYFCFCFYFYSLFIIIEFVY
jgi:hypothetical protein